MATLWIQGTGQASLKPQHISSTKWGYTYFFTNEWHFLEICSTANLKSVRQELCILTLLVRNYHSAYRLESCTYYTLICVPYQIYIFGAPQTSSNYSAPGDSLVSTDIEYLYGDRALTSGGDGEGLLCPQQVRGLLLQLLYVFNTWNKHKV